MKGRGRKKKKRKKREEQKMYGFYDFWYGTMTMSKNSSKIWYESLVLYGYYLAQT